MAEIKQRSNEVVLPPGKFVFIQDGTKGSLKVYVGPILVNQSGTDDPMIYDEKTGFSQVDDLESAIQTSHVAPEGFYAILTNPTEKNDHPVPGEQRISPDLKVGHKIVMPGPVMFALWPGQKAKVIRGHHLRSNQYLLCRVYNEEQARANWSRAVVKTQSVKETPKEGDVRSLEPGDVPKAVETKAPDPVVTEGIPDDLSVGKQFIIKGTDVSFYIPPTGVSVEEEGKGTGKYVREALTLKQLEYCRLLDEDGTQRYPKGPAVVFPEPTETFKEEKDEEGLLTKKFRAIELNAIQGLHVKITKSYKDMDLLDPATGEKGWDLKEGDEIFIKGGPSEKGGISIYYPREEHAIVSYDGKSKQFAVAIPPGEARYVMDRMEGIINSIHGPTMLLPNPVHEVIVRRVLSEDQCRTWYPENLEVLEYNYTLRAVAAHAPTTRQGVVSEGDLERSMRSRGGGATKGLSMNAMSMDTSRVGSARGPASADEISRGSSYSAPRTITLGDKFGGVPAIKPFIGFAVMVVNTKGERRVVQGPANILLEYDETLEILSMSTNKPKTTDSLIRTPYLRVSNNKVTDIIYVETSDHVTVQTKVSYLVNFEGDPNKWFEVENYVKFLCDHMRSVLKGAIKKIRIEDFYANSTDIIRDLVLGEKTEAGRSGFTFKENGMKVSDVEVLEAIIPDPAIANMLNGVQKEIVRGNIELSQARRALETAIEKEKLTIQGIEVRAATEKRKLEIEDEKSSAQMAVQLKRIVESISESGKAQELEIERQKLQDIATDADLDRDKKQDLARDRAARLDQVRLLEKIAAEAEAAVKKFTAMKDSGLTEALLALSSNEALEKIAKAASAQMLFGGSNVVDVMEGVLGKAAAPLLDAIRNKMSHGPSNGKIHAEISPVATT
jgi:major vault protein